MGKIPTFPRARVKEIREKIRAVVKKNPALQAQVDAQVAAVKPKNKPAARALRRKAYSDLIQGNELLRDEVRKIIQVMTP